MTFPKFDTTISVGHILIFLGLMGSLTAAYVAVEVALAQHQQRLDVIETQLSTYRMESREMIMTLSNIRTDIAVIRQRLEFAEGEVLQLRPLPREDDD